MSLRKWVPSGLVWLLALAVCSTARANMVTVTTSENTSANQISFTVSAEVDVPGYGLGAFDLNFYGNTGNAKSVPYTDPVVTFPNLFDQASGGFATGGTVVNGTDVQDIFGQFESAGGPYGEGAPQELFTVTYTLTPGATGMQTFGVGPGSGADFTLTDGGNPPTTPSSVDEDAIFTVTYPADTTVTVSPNTASTPLPYPAFAGIVLMCGMLYFSYRKRASVAIAR